MPKTINQRGYYETIFALRRFWLLARRYKATPVMRETQTGWALFAVADQFALSWAIGPMNFGDGLGEKSKQAQINIMKRYTFFDYASFDVRQKVIAFDVNYAPTVLHMLSFAEYLDRKNKYVLVYRRGRVYQIPDLATINDTISGKAKSRIWMDDQLYITFSAPQRASVLLISINVACRLVRDSISAIVWGTPATSLENLQAPE